MTQSAPTGQENWILIKYIFLISLFTLFLKYSFLNKLKGRSFCYFFDLLELFFGNKVNWINQLGSTASYSYKRVRLVTFRGHLRSQMEKGSKSVIIYSFSKK